MNPHPKPSIDSPPPHIDTFTPIHIAATYKNHNSPVPLLTPNIFETSTHRCFQIYSVTWQRLLTHTQQCPVLTKLFIGFSLQLRAKTPLGVWVLRLCSFVSVAGDGYGSRQVNIIIQQILTHDNMKQSTSLHTNVEWWGVNLAEFTCSIHEMNDPWSNVRAQKIKVSWRGEIFLKWDNKISALSLVSVAWKHSNNDHHPTATCWK